MVFRQFPIARFMLSFIVFILCYIAAGNFRDGFYQLLIAGLFVFTLYILSEVKRGQEEALKQRDALWAEKILELEDNWRWETYRRNAGALDTDSEDVEGAQNLD